MGDLSYGLKALRENQEFVDEAQSFYEGTAAEIFATANIARILRSTGDKFRVNYARKAVDAPLNRLEINSITSTDNAQQEAIDALWRANNLGLEARAIHQAALEYGETYLICWPNDDESSVDMRHNTPHSVRAFYDVENPHVMTFAIKAWTEPVEGKLRLNLYYADRIERYISVGKTKGAKVEKDFIPFVDEGEDEDAWPITNPFGRVPVIHFRTEGQYGSPEHAPAYGPQNALNKLFVTQMAVVDFQSFPQRYGLAEAGKPATEADDIFDDAEVGTANSVDAGFVASPGSMALFEGLSKVGEFTAADPKNFLEPIGAYVQHMAAVTDTPVHIIEGGVPPSGESRRRAEAALNKKIGNRQLTFGEAWENAFGFALNILGFSTNEDTLAVTWAPVEDSEDKDSWDLVKAKIDNGVPPRRALMEAGYTDDEVTAFGFPDNSNPEVIPSE